MSQFDEMLKAVTFRYNNKIQKECEVLFRSFNLNEFWCYKITNDGFLSYVGSHVGINEYFATEQGYLNYPYFRDPKHLKEGISFMKAVPHKALADLLDFASEEYDFYHSLVIMTRTDEGMECTGFSSSSSNESQIAMLLNELPSLRMFAGRFRKENRLLFARMEDNKIDLAELVGPAFYEKGIDLIPYREKEALIRKMGLDANLTSKEMDLLKMLILGYSAAQIAAKSNRSKRTVEHQIERLKDKFFCQSKFELIEKGRELESLGFGK